MALMVTGSQYFHYNSVPFLLYFLLLFFFFGLIYFPRAQFLHRAKFMVLYGFLFASLCAVFITPNLLTLKRAADMVKVDNSPTKAALDTELIKNYDDFKKEWNSIFYPPGTDPGSGVKSRSSAFAIWGLLFMFLALFLPPFKRHQAQTYCLIGLVVWTQFLISPFPKKLGMFFVSSYFYKMLMFVPVTLGVAFFFFFLLRMILFLGHKVILPILNSHKVRMYKTALLILNCCFFYIIIWDMYPRITKNYEAFELMKRRSAVFPEDLKAFEWIKNSKELDPSKHFLGRTFLGWKTAFIMDAALYLEYYTGFEVMLSFFPTPNFYRTTKEHQNYYVSLVSKYINHPKMLKILKDLQIKYIYLSRRVFAWPGLSGLSYQRLSSFPDKYKLLYNESGVSIWEIL